MPKDLQVSRLQLHYVVLCHAEDLCQPHLVSIIKTCCKFSTHTCSNAYMHTFKALNQLCSLPSPLTAPAPRCKRTKSLIPIHPTSALHHEPGCMEVKDRTADSEKAEVMEDCCVLNEKEDYGKTPEEDGKIKDNINHQGQSKDREKDERRDARTQMILEMAGDDAEVENVYDEVASEAEAAEGRSPAAESADAKARNKEGAYYCEVHVAKKDSKKDPASCEFRLTSFNLHCHTSNATLSHVIPMLKLKVIFANAGSTIHV